jgi:hypothetical protein
MKMWRAKAARGNMAAMAQEITRGSGSWVPVVFGMMNQQEHACCFLSVSGRVFQRRWKNDVQKGECVSSVCSPLVSTIIRISK